MLPEKPLFHSNRPLKNKACRNSVERGPAPLDHHFAKPDQVEDLVVCSDVGVFDGHARHVRGEHVSEQGLVRVALAVVLYPDL